MIVWLDNQDNHDGAINENYGRELLELFSMGVGSYSEDDIKEAARAFTGWSIGNTEYMVLRSNRDSDWPLRPHRVALRAQGGRPRRRREDLPRRDGTLQRRGHRRHHMQAGGYRPVHLAPHVPLLRGRRAAGTRMAARGAARPRGHPPAGGRLLRQRLLDQGDVEDSLQLRLLQVRGGQVQEGQEPGGADDGCAAAVGAHRPPAAGG